MKFIRSKIKKICTHPKDKNWPTTCPHVDSETCNGCDYFKAWFK